jgi:hypothetical protein
MIYDKYLRDETKLEDILPGDLKVLAGPLWFNHMYDSRPPIEDSTKFKDEIRRREIAAATKPMKEINRDFFKDDKE